MKFFRRKKWRRPYNAVDDSQVYRFNRLADYNSEVARGILHTKEYDELMAKTQAEFDAFIIEGGKQ